MVEPFRNRIPTEQTPKPEPGSSHPMFNGKCGHCRRPHGKTRDDQPGGVRYCDDCEAERRSNLERYADRYDRGEPLFA